MLRPARDGSLQSLMQHEWLECNQYGTYSTNTWIDCPTRRYHGLLVSDASHLEDKWVLLSKVELSLSYRGRTIDLYTNKFPGGVFLPEAYSHFQGFTYDLFPSSRYRVGPCLVQRSLMLLHDRDAVVLRYSLLEGEPCRLQLRPLLAYRKHHQLRQETQDLQVKTFVEQNAWKIEPIATKPPLYMNADREIDFYPGPFWLKQIEYEREQERGYDYQEDLFCPGVFEVSMEPKQEVYLAFSLDNLPRETIQDAWHQELSRRVAQQKRFVKEQRVLGALKYEAEKFLIKRRDGRSSVVAGYPWFGEWGRDAMIALPGLTLSRGEPQRLLEVVSTFLDHARDGLIPNFLGNQFSPAAYNSIDAGLWLFQALQAYVDADAPLEPLRPLLAPLRQLLLDLQSGRCPVARCTDEGLLEAGDPNSQLTWMDAKVHGTPVTPRHGLAVEINALWFNALAFLCDLERRCGEVPNPIFLDLIERFPAAFRKEFWLPDDGYLADAVQLKPERKQDKAIRPNQIFAVSLLHSPLSLEQQQSVVRVVTSHLLTPFGLRTLSPSDAAFEPFYKGNPAQRDQAYHQGTVWPWLLYAYVKAYLRVHQNSAEARQFLIKNIEILWTKHPEEYGVMGISEIFDALPPHRADGCISQAWSVAELIRVMELLKLDDATDSVENRSQE